MSTTMSSLPSSFPFLPLRNGVLFPGTVITVPVGRARSISMIEDLGPNAIIGIAVGVTTNSRAPIPGDAVVYTPTF